MATPSSRGRRWGGGRRAAAAGTGHVGVEQAEEGNRDMFSSALEYVLNRKLLKKKVSVALSNFLRERLPIYMVSSKIEMHMLFIILE